MERKDLNQQLEIIACGNHDEIMAYLAECSFGTEAQIALIERGDHDEIATLNKLKEK